jgi:hypothetical protein
MWFANNFVNRNGIATLDSVGVNVGTDSVVFNLRTNFDRFVPYRGLILVRLNEVIPTGTTTTLPIKLQMNGATENVTTYGGENWTVADVAGTGIYLMYYNRNAGILQVLTGIN